MSIDTQNFKEMDIGKLRQYAAHLRLAIAKTSTKAEIVEAIERKLNGRTVPEFANADTSLKPGYDRISIMSDPMPGASNLPVFVNANGYTCLIPRDVEVVVPHRVTRVLRDATVKRRKQTLLPDANGREIFRETTVNVPSYPFQVLESCPGPEVLTKREESHLKTIEPRRRYRDMFGHWPKPRELTRAIEQKLISLKPDELLPDAAAKLLGESDTV